MPDQMCNQCQTIFQAPNSRFINKIHKFCSKKCEGDWKKIVCTSKVKIVCPICSSEFFVKKSRIKRVKNKELCCSKKCSNKLKEKIYLSSSNPNYKIDYDRTIFDNIDSELKAYLLGWIASDGHINSDRVTIKLHKKDITFLSLLFKSLLNCDIKIKYSLIRDTGYISLYSKHLSNSIKNHLKIEFKNTNYKLSYKKDTLVKFPDLSSDELKWSFIRGYFDGDGCVINPYREKNTPCCSIASYSPYIKEEIYNFSKIPGSVSSTKIDWSGSNALDFLGKIYDNSNYRLERKFELYRRWSIWVPGICGNKSGGADHLLHWVRINKNAVPPYKAHASDSGYDLTLVELVKKVGDLEYYTTNIRIKPTYGIYFDLVPRSSMPKTGYCIANDIGIIDRSYTGPVIAILRKFDKKSEDLKLPARVVQIIPRPIIHCQVEEVDSFEDSLRSGGGFGHTGV